MIRPFLLAMLLSSAAQAREPWLVLPPTPVLPHPDRAATPTLNGVTLYYAVYGTGHGSPVLLLHGGLANANYWGDLVAALRPAHEVIVLDSRGHGRSSRNATRISYEVMAADAVALMDTLIIPKAAVIGWSDGAITGLVMAMRHKDRVTRLFAFGANASPAGVKDVRLSPVFTAFIARAGQEYHALNPVPGGYAAFDADIERMWASEPHFSATDLRTITVPVWIADGDHEEAIKRSDTDFLAANIPDARELILPGVSHFAFLQDPGLFTQAVQDFLAEP